jgi:hypothetical protein
MDGFGDYIVGRLIGCGLLLGLAFAGLILLVVYLLRHITIGWT